MQDCQSHHYFRLSLGPDPFPLLTRFFSPPQFYRTYHSLCPSESRSLARHLSLLVLVVPRLTLRLGSPLTPSQTSG